MNQVYWVFVFMFIVSCRAKLDVVQTEGRRCQGDHCTAAEGPSAGVAVKLQSEDCVDPDLAKVAKGEKLMLCDGTQTGGISGTRTDFQ